MCIYHEYVACYELFPVADDPGLVTEVHGGDLHDTLAVPNGHNGRKDDDILRRSAVCMEVDIPADMNCTVVELNDVTILRRRLPQRQDSAEHQECYINVSDTAVEFNDVVFLPLRLPRTEVFAEGVMEKCIVPRTDSVSGEQDDRTFCRPKLPGRVVFTDQDRNCSDTRGNSAVSEPCDHLYRRRSLPPNRARTDFGGLIHRHITFFRPIPAVFAFMTRYQQDLELKRKECKERFG